VPSARVKPARWLVDSSHKSAYMSMFRRRSILTACLILCIIAASAFKADEPSGEVVHLTDENFDKLTDGELPWMVAVTAPW